MFCFHLSKYHSFFFCFLKVILGDGSQLLVQNEDGTTTLGDAQLMSVMEGGDKDDPQAQIVAQVVQAGDAPPGGMI